jgi:hypothetical protein
MANPGESPTPTFDCETKYISGWCCILMTCSHSSRCWNTIYMYEEDLLWVWSGWGASIIMYSMIQVGTQELLLPLYNCETKYISGWNCVCMTTSHSSRCWNTIYMYEEEMLWVWCGWGASIITYSMIQVTDQENFLWLWPHLSERPSIGIEISGPGCNLVTTSHSRRCQSALHMYDKDLIWVWRVRGMPIIT